MSRGSVARTANRLTMAMPENPHASAKPMHRLIVGSSWVSSAVDGLSPTKTHAGPRIRHILRSTYR